jgi:hypothetical protein
MAWRPMTAEEAASLPEARLAGSLLWIFTAACALALILPIGLMLIPALWMGAIIGEFGPWRALFYWRGQIGVTFAVPWFCIMAWSIAFAFMTIIRWRATPIVASVGLAIWLIVRVVLTIGGQLASLSIYTGPTSGVILSSWPIAVSLITDTMLALAFCAYMRDGTRPNGYYRQLIRANG